MSRTQRQVFTLVYACPGLTLNELAHHTGLNPVTIARQVRSLEQVRPAVTNTARLRRRMCRLVSPAPWTVNP
ncbi:winged helix-turn-helix domain-containing protein [Deinococcus hohokamensis]|uniref:Winged helix-turn-helix domain-containing protein n=1 Tax=Deinococcus hohokamensis TaxID=309883 RepID=A0ABV9I8A7_9DEIO